MKIRELEEAIAQQVPVVQPSVVRQQNKVANVVKQIAATDAQKPATEEEKVLAMWKVRDLKKHTDKVYAQRLRQQLANAEAVVGAGSKRRVN